MTSQQLSTLESLASLTAAQRERLIAEEARKHGVTPAKLKAMLLRNWRFVGRPKQQPPPEPWTFWFIRAGRGFGKTITAAQYVKKRALEAKIRVALVAPTFGDVRDTMIEGETGLLSVIPAGALLGQSRETAYNRSIGELTLANGTRFRAFSSVEPNRIRGPQNHLAWCEEMSSWKDAHKGNVQDTTWNNVILSTRLGEDTGVDPKFVITSTPKTNKLTRELIKLAQTPACVMTIGSSFENQANLAETWWEQVVVPMLGTRTGRQEIEAELLEDVEGALWTRERIERMRLGNRRFESLEDYDAAGMPPLSRIVVGVDPNASSTEASNSAGVIVVGAGAGAGRQRKGYVLDDRTIDRGGPRAWARAAADAYHDWQADRIVAEKNNGGEMVRITLETVDANLPIELVNASKGKRTRAEPISSLYEGDEGQGNPPRVHHVGTFPLLEDEQCTWTPEADSPDRMDALVWAMTELLIGGGSGTYRSSIATGVLPEVVGDDPTFGRIM